MILTTYNKINLASTRQPSAQNMIYLKIKAFLKLFTWYLYAYIYVCSVSFSHQFLKVKI